jgi:hypothetical protein
MTRGIRRQHRAQNGPLSVVAAWKQLVAGGCLVLQLMGDNGRYSCYPRIPPSLMTSGNNRIGIMVVGFSPLTATTTAAAPFRRRHAHNSGPLLVPPPQRSLCHAEQSGLRDNDRLLLLRAAPTTELNSSGNNADFAYQELKVLLDAMRRSNVVRLRDVSTETATALVSYVTQVVTTRRSSNRPCMPNDNLLDSDNQEIVWRLALTTEDTLPRDATVLITFPAQLSSSSSTHQDLVYSLAFGTQTMGLNRLDVACQYTIATSTYDALPIVTYTYQSLTMNAFGYENIDLCLFGMWIKGRTTILHTAYIDESLWIERAVDNDDNGGANTAAWNVYVRFDSDSDPSW